MATYTLGSKVEIHNDYDYENNCVVCAKKLGKSHAQVFLTQSNELISESEYEAAWNRDENYGEFCHIALVGSTCVNKFEKAGA